MTITPTSLRTCYGSIQLTFTSSTHAYADANSNGAFLTIGPTKAQVTAHLYRWADKKFRVGQHGDPLHVRHHSLSARKPDKPYGQDHLTTRQQDLLIEEIERAVNAFLVNNTDLLQEAEYLHLEEQTTRLENDIATKHAELTKLTRQLDELRVAMTAINKETFLHSLPPPTNPPAES